jgi:hypothetical protein
MLYARARQGRRRSNSGVPERGPNGESPGSGEPSEGEGRDSGSQTDKPSSKRKGKERKERRTKKIAEEGEEIGTCQTRSTAANRGTIKQLGTATRLAVDWPPPKNGNETEIRIDARRREGIEMIGDAAAEDDR